MARALPLYAGMIDPIFQSDSMQLARKFLDAAALRQDAIASNIANSETPGYHRMDVAPNFAAQMKAAWDNGQFSSDADAIKPALAEDPQARSVRPDGNNVELEKELLAMDHNSVDYEYLADVVTSNIKELRMAITGAAS